MHQCDCGAELTDGWLGWIRLSACCVALHKLGSAAGQEWRIKSCRAECLKHERCKAVVWAVHGWPTSGLACADTLHCCQSPTLTAVATAVVAAAAAGGPKAMCFGCASFAAFSTAIEYFTGGH